MNTLTANLLLSTLVFWVAVRIYLVPRLPELRPQTVLLPILLLHSFRHLGLMFLAPGATYAGIPRHFAYPAAFGDLLAAVLALAALPAVAKDLRSARALVWVFNVEGMLDLIAAITLATVDVIVTTHKSLVLVFHTQVYKLKRDMSKKSRPASAASCAFRQNEVMEVPDENPAHSQPTHGSRPAPTGAGAQSPDDHSGTSGGPRCK